MSQIIFNKNLDQILILLKDNSSLLGVLIVTLLLVSFVFSWVGGTQEKLIQNTDYKGKKYSIGNSVKGIFIMIIASLILITLLFFTLSHFYPDLRSLFSM